MSKFTKRILSTLMVICMLACMCLPGLTVSAADISFSLDFESETVGAAPQNTALTIKNTSETNTVIITADPKNANNKVLVLNRPSKSTTPCALVNVPTQTGEFTVEYRIMFDGDSQYAALVQSGTGTDKQGVYLLARDQTYATNPGELLNHDGSAWNTLFNKEEFKYGEWYSVKIEIDVASTKYDISVTDSNGVTKTSAEAGFKSAGITALDYLNFQHAGKNKTGAIYVDDIKVYTPGQTPETPDTPDTPDTSEELAKLQAAIAKVESDLAKANADLTKAITDGDKALDTKITALNEAVEAAKKAYAAADTAMQNTLTAKIEAADKTLDDAIKAVQKNLTDAKTALEAADKKSADDLAKAIGDLNTAINAAKAAATTADGAVKTELSAKIENADETLKASIDTLTAELQSVKQALETKDAEIESLIGTVRIIAIAAICLSVISIVFAFIGKKKK